MGRGPTEIAMALSLPSRTHRATDCLETPRSSAISLVCISRSFVMAGTSRDGAGRQRTRRLSDHRKEHGEHRERYGGGPPPDAVLWVHAYTTTSRQRPAPLLHRRPAEGGHHRVLRLRWHDWAGTGGLHAELPA